MEITSETLVGFGWILLAGFTICCACYCTNDVVEELKRLNSNIERILERAEGRHER